MRKLLFSQLSIALAAVLGAACAPALLPTPPVGETYGSQAEQPPALTADERLLVDQVNAELAKAGFPKAVPGSYEMEAAAVIANAGVAKHTGAAAAVMRGSGLSGATAEEPNEEGKIHVARKLLAAGLAPVPIEFQLVDFPQHELEPDQVKTLVKKIRPTTVYGELRIGAAILAAGWDNHRIFVVALRDEQIDVTSAPPRTPALSSSFTAEGKVASATVGKLKLAVLRPDGKVDQANAERQGDTFRVSYTFPQAPGRYLVSIGPGVGLYTVPVFVGVDPTPWPPSAAKDAAAPDNAKDLAKQLATSLEKARTAQGLPALPMPSELSAFAKSLAKERAKIHLEGKGSPLAWGSPKEQRERFVAAGLDPDSVKHFNGRLLGEGVPDVLAAFPYDAFAFAALACPEAAQFGIGVAPETKDAVDDDAYYHVVWMVVRKAAHKGAAPAASAAAR